VSLNPYFYQAEGGDEGLNMDEEWDGVPVGWCVFLPFSIKRNIENDLPSLQESLKLTYRS
jgi:hypothetical protein